MGMSFLLWPTDSSGGEAPAQHPLICFRWQVWPTEACSVQIQSLGRLTPWAGLKDPTSNLPTVQCLRGHDLIRGLRTEAHMMFEFCSNVGNMQERSGTGTEKDRMVATRFWAAGNSQGP